MWQTLSGESAAFGSPSEKLAREELASNSKAREMITSYKIRLIV